MIKGRKLNSWKPSRACGYIQFFTFFTNVCGQYLLNLLLVYEKCTTLRFRHDVHSNVIYYVYYYYYYYYYYYTTTAAATTTTTTATTTTIGVVVVTIATVFG